MHSSSQHFFMAFVPPTATKQEHRISTQGGRVTVFPSASWAAAEDDLIAHLERYRPKRPIDGGVMLEATWCFPLSGHADGEPRVTKPDCDNLMKGLKDVMTLLGWWHDDAQVFSETCTKVWSEIPGIRIDIDVVEVWR